MVPKKVKNFIHVLVLVLVLALLYAVSSGVRACGCDGGMRLLGADVMEIFVCTEAAMRARYR